MELEKAIKHNIHQILAHSYFVYFISLLVGVSLDLIFGLKVFKSSIVTPIGFVLLVLSTLLILWAQKTSRKLNKEHITRETFTQGPYSFTKTPTHWGLFLLILGFGMILNAFFVILTTVLALIVTRFLFLDKQDEMMEKKYGAPYLEYKKLVRF